MESLNGVLNIGSNETLGNFRKAAYF